MERQRAPEAPHRDRSPHVGLRLLASIAVMIAAWVVAPTAVSSSGVRDGATATWQVDESSPPTESSTSFTALVTRLGCSGGETGVVLEPTVAVEADRLVVTFEVEALPPGAYTCPGNRPVPYTVELDEPLGRRTLVDGACLTGEAVTTAFCAEGATRWSPTPAPTTSTTSTTTPGTSTSTPSGPAPGPAPARPLPARPTFTG